MNDRDLSIREQTSEIEKGIEKALKEIDLIQKEKNLVKTAEELEALERRIVEATDKLAGALVAQKVQASIYGEELKGRGCPFGQEVSQEDEKPGYP